MSGDAKPKRIQRKRTKGWRMPEGAVYVGRPTKWGNPFNFRPADCCWLALSYGCRGDFAGRMQASVMAYRDWLSAPVGQRVAEYERGVVIEAQGKQIDVGPRIKLGAAPSVADIITELRGHDLACFCPLDQPCHADILLELANAP